MSVSSSQRLMKCPKCLTPNNVTKSRPGTKVRCSKCGSMITVREPGTASSTSAPAPAPSRREDSRGGRASGVHSRGGGRASGVHSRGGRESGVHGRGARGRGAPIQEEEMAPERGRGRPRGEKVDSMPLIILGVFIAGFLAFLLFLVTSNKSNAPAAKIEDDKPKKGQPVLAEAPPDPKLLDPKNWVPDTPAYQGDKTEPPAQGDSPDGDSSKGGSDGTGENARPREDHMKIDAALRGEIEGLLARWQDMGNADIEKEEATIVGKGTPAIPCLIMAVGSADEWVSKYATRVLKKMTGHEYSWSPGMSQSDREAQRDKWIRWWNDNATAYAAGTGEAQVDAKDAATSKLLDEVLAGYTTADLDGRLTREKRIVRQGKEIVPAMIAKLTYEIKDIAAGAARMLVVLTKEESFGDFSPDYPAPYQQKWQEWWEKNKESFEFNY